MSVTFKPVKNFTKDRYNKIKGVCIHIADGTASQVYSTFKHEQKSAHYLVLRNGDIWQFVREEDTAWTQGLRRNSTAKMVLETKESPNDYLIGIEHEGYGNQDLTDIQYASSAKLLGEICLRHQIPIDRAHIIGHNEIRNDKACPGILSMSKLIGLAQNPPQISQIDELKIKISLLQKILDLMKALNAKKLGNTNICELD